MKPAYLAAILIILSAALGSFFASLLWGLIIAGLAILEALLRMIGGAL